MIDRLFTAALAFCILAGGTAAIGSALFGLDSPALRQQQAAAGTVIQLPRVEIVGKRVPATEVARAETDAARTQQ